MSYSISRRSRLAMYLESSFSFAQAYRSAASPETLGIMKAELAELRGDPPAKASSQKAKPKARKRRTSAKK